MSYTFSKISSYLSCPRKFKYQYIDKIKVPLKDCFKKGNAIHNILEKYRADNQIASTIVNSFFESELGKEFKNILTNKNTKREISIGLTNDFKNCSYYDKQCFYRGRVDLVFVDDNNILNIVDYKTGKYKEERFQDFNQLLTYALYFFNSSRIERVKLRYVYVEHCLENTLEISKDVCMSTVKYISDSVNSIENDNKFMKKISKLCDYCEFKETCDKN